LNPKDCTIMYLEATAIVHSTEDIEKVRKALMEVFPPSVRSSIKIEQDEATGHFGNPIIRLSARVDCVDAESTLRYILGRLDDADVGYLKGSLEDRVDKNGVLYLRLSKQDAYLGRLSIYEADDVVRISVHIRGRRRSVMRVLENILSKRG